MGTVRSDSLMMARCLSGNTSILDATEAFHFGGSLGSITANGWGWES